MRGKHNFQNVHFMNANQLIKNILSQYKEKLIKNIYGPTPLWDSVQSVVANECANYVCQNMQDALQFERKNDFWDFIIKQSPCNSFWEFGVCKGVSLRYFSRHFKSLHGFDSFEGLQENWRGHNLASGAFSVHGKIPKLDKNVSLYPGWFCDTVSYFLSKNQDIPDVIHVDCDTYESSFYILNNIVSRVKPGCIIIFDEYLLYRGWKTGEFKAWSDIRLKYGLKYTYIAFSEMSVAIKVN